MVLSVAFTLSGVSPSNMDTNTQEYLQRMGSILSTVPREGVDGTIQENHMNGTMTITSHRSSLNSNNTTIISSITNGDSRRNLIPYFDLLTALDSSTNPVQAVNPNTPVRNDDMWWNNRLEDIHDRPIDRDGSQTIEDNSYAYSRVLGPNAQQLIRPDQMDIAYLQQQQQQQPQPRKNRPGHGRYSHKESPKLQYNIPDAQIGNVRLENYPTCQMMELEPPIQSRMQSNNQQAAEEPNVSLIDLAPKAAFIADFAAHLRANFTNPLMTHPMLCTASFSSEQNRSIPHRLAGFELPDHVKSQCAECDYVDYSYFNR